MALGKRKRNMKTEITTPARKIAKTHNARLAAGFAGNGFLVFGKDGSGGAWYSDNSWPGIGAEEIKISMRWERMTGAQAQEALA